MDKLEKSIHRSNNLGWMFLRGIAYGIGWFIGGALLATIAIYFLSWTPENNALGRFVHDIIRLIQQ
ncbi:MAG: hypothetical protein COU31_04190 [Candidatus Magasanikbacteria bacterium CG10_big_fil_rev_8_21_14_0_10_40_10]|uniref:Uncharacterized protein n=1 Tax=Candidatus Magasanikbacteria bacterium CG10_big_fil_rev_8_21_14_0_10_40_10 TaxID=1974648 RepID=A0A2M6W327_9BACT|nr:MAG: hypothetical protein COU31_04190 [Candidatus Magasanikbacteria bacterium CG10_big_fil_rev_8_21_14_0_10_40_10]